MSSLDDTYDKFAKDAVIDIPKEGLEFWHGEKRIGIVPAGEVEIVHDRFGHLLYISISDEFAQELMAILGVGSRGVENYTYCRGDNKDG